MPQIAWRSRMSVGVDSIDDDHKRLIDCLNDLDRAIEGETYDARTVARQLLALVQYTRVHFDREEELMRSVNYPEYEEHRREHEHGRGELEAISRDFCTDPNKEAATRIYQFVLEWLMRHIMMVDTRLARHVNAGPVRARPHGARIPRPG